jgi:hypothetical protein
MDFDSFWVWGDFPKLFLTAGNTLRARVNKPPIQIAVKRSWRKVTNPKMIVLLNMRNFPFLENDYCDVYPPSS